jgi:hypothetical protein
MPEVDHTRAVECFRWDRPIAVANDAHGRRSGTLQMVGAVSAPTIHVTP